MESRMPRSVTTVSVYTRHSPDCPKKADSTWRRCRCRKYLYIYEGGRAKQVSAKTRTWEKAEKLAEAERARRDPVNIELEKIKEREAQQAALLAKQAAAEQEKNTTVDDAVDRWIATLKYKTPQTLATYARAGRRIKNWAGDQKIGNLVDVTPAKLGEWQGKWGKEATEKYNRMGQASQNQFQDYLSRFCLWATNMEYVRMDPSRFLPSIAKNDDQTQPLTPKQFNELLQAVDPFCQSMEQGIVRDWAAELKALFQFQRWAGLRIIDCLMFPRSGLVGNCISLVTKKTGAKIEDRHIPDHVAEALHALSPDRPGWRPEYFFWRENYKLGSLSRRYIYIIGKLNKFLAFKDEDGKPMRFHSHQLRDTFAVELLLASVLLEDVSRLLTHESILVTQKHYSPWVKERKKQLEDGSVEAMRRMGVIVSAK
jgi:integrase